MSSGQAWRIPTQPLLILNDTESQFATHSYTITASGLPFVLHAHPPLLQGFYAARRTGDSESIDRLLERITIIRKYMGVEDEGTYY